MGMLAMDGNEESTKSTHDGSGDKDDVSGDDSNEEKESPNKEEYNPDTYEDKMDTSENGTEHEISSMDSHYVPHMEPTKSEEPYQAAAVKEPENNKTLIERGV